jgi:hypothetical protein
MPSRERKICSRKYLQVLEKRICYWIVQVTPESSARKVPKIYLVFETFDNTCIFFYINIRFDIE